MVRAFLFKEITGRNQLDMERDLHRRPLLIDTFGLEDVPDQSTFSRTWAHRFDEPLRTFIENAAEICKQAAYEQGLPESRLAPPAEPLDEGGDADTDDDPQFSDEQIHRTTRLARQHGFTAFDSERAYNATYNDTCFWEMQAFLCMSACGTPQGARRFARRSNRQQTPHGDTLLRTIKQFGEKEAIESFHESARLLVDNLRRTSALREPVNVAIDITEEPYWGSGMPRTTGSKEERYERAHKYATLTAIGPSAPVILAITPVVPEDSRDDYVEKPKHQIVAELLVQALDLVDIHKVFCDRGFDAKLVHQVIDNLGLTYVIPRRHFSLEKEVIEKINDHAARAAVEPVTLTTGEKSHEMNFMYVPSTKGEGHTAFATNREVSADRAIGLCSQYRRRWRIENEYKSLKYEFQARTASRDFSVRLFQFVFQCLLYNIWRATDAFLKLRVGRDIDEAPFLTAGEFLEIATKFLRPGG